MRDALLPEDVYAAGDEYTSRPGSAIGADYDGGRYIVLDINRDLHLYDLWTGAITTYIDYGLDSVIRGDYVAYVSTFPEPWRVKLYCISTGEIKDLTPLYRIFTCIFSGWNIYQL